MSQEAAKAPVRIAVVTGGHSFDIVNFHALWRSFDGIDAYVQHMDDFASSPQQVRRSYDAVLFYTMFRETPGDEDLPWYRGQPKAALEHLGNSGQGIFMLHHALLAYPQWPLWRAFTGIDGHEAEPHPNESIDVTVVDASHPITAGVEPWNMVDETYEMPEPDEDSCVLLTTNHNKSLKAIAWTRHYGPSRIFCLQLGHDSIAWQNPRFNEMVWRGLLWCARRI